MKRVIISVIILFAFLGAHAVDFFQGNYKEALEKAKNENRYIFLYFTSPYCGPCNYMSRYVFPEPEVDAYVNANYIALKVNTSLPENQELFLKYCEEKGVPKCVLIDENEKVVKSNFGGMTLLDFKNFMKLKDSTKPICQVIVAPEVMAGYPEPPTMNEYKKARYDTLTISRWYPNFRLGMTFNKFHSSGDFAYDDMVIGYNVGLGATYETKRFLFQPGLFFTSKGGRSKDLDEKLRIHYMEIPLNCSVELFRHHLNCGDKIRLNVAPYAALALAVMKTEGEDKYRMKLGRDEGELNRWDYGVRVGISLGLGSFEPYFGYDFGLNNLSNTDGNKIYNRGFYFATALILGR